MGRAAQAEQQLRQIVAMASTVELVEHQRSELCYRLLAAVAVRVAETPIHIAGVAVVQQARAVQMRTVACHRSTSAVDITSVEIRLAMSVVAGQAR